MSYAYRGTCFAVWIILAVLFVNGAHAQTKVYWTEHNVAPKIHRSNLDGTAAEIIVDWSDLLWNSALPWMEGLAVDSQAGKIYWVGSYPDPLGGLVQRANLDGSDQEILIVDTTGSPLDIVLHFEESKMYWTTTGWIRRANLDGSDVEDVIDLDGRSSSGLVINPINRKIYWNDTDLTIKRANLNGSEVETVVTLTSSINKPLAIDPLRGKIFWIDDAVVRSASMDGTGVKDLCAATGTSMGLSIDFDEGKMYWGSFGSNNIWKADLDGSTVEVAHSSTIGSLAIGLDNQRGVIPLPLSTPASLLFLSFLLCIVGLSLFSDKGTLSLARTARYNRSR